MSDAPAAPSPAALQTLSRDWLTRVIVGLLLAALVGGAIFAGTPYLALIVAGVALAAAREWFRMVSEGRFGATLPLTVTSIWLALAAFVLWPHGYVAELILLCGTVLVLALGLARKGRALWQAGGVFYLGAPALAILALRAIPEDGAYVTMALFLVVWATDTGAMVIGKLIGGPKLAPLLSPNKTWAGTLGGIASASLVLSLYVALLDGDVVLAALFGAAMAVMAHLGDLFESMVKRRFRAKDSGGLIPGHGGVLDRVDSTLSAALALAIAVFLFHVDPLFGAKP